MKSRERSAVPAIRNGSVLMSDILEKNKPTKSLFFKPPGRAFPPPSTSFLPLPSTDDVHPRVKPRGRIVHSPALQRADDLDRVTGVERSLIPGRAAHHRAVDRDGEKPRGRVDAARREKLRDRRHRDLLVDAVDLEPGHCAASATGDDFSSWVDFDWAKRCGSKGRAISGSRPLRM